jgi:hypothetical protein
VKRTRPTPRTPRIPRTLRAERAVHAARASHNDKDIIHEEATSLMKMINKKQINTQEDAHAPPSDH